jgi:uncharacterized protein
MTEPSKIPHAKTPPAKPLPTIDDENRPFWDGANQGILQMQHCDVCGHIRFPIQPLCPRCLGSTFTWRRLSGRGEVYSKIVYHRAFSPAFSVDVPYNLVMVQLEEGPRMFSNVVGTANDAFGVGDLLEVVFDRVSDDVCIPRFRVREHPGEASSN